jgi:hypothetical protein
MNKRPELLPWEGTSLWSWPLLVALFFAVTLGTVALIHWLMP